MNTVFFTSAPDSSAALKARPSRQAHDTAADDASGFAGVLASQAAAQPQNSGAAAHGSAAADTSAPAAKTGSAKSDTPARQTEPSAIEGKHADKRTLDGDRRADTRAHDMRALALDGIADKTVHTTETARSAIRSDDAASLPERFAQIIAAVEKTGARPSDAAAEGKPGEPRLHGQADHTNVAGASEAAARKGASGPDRPNATEHTPALRTGLINTESIEPRHSIDSRHTADVKFSDSGTTPFTLADSDGIPAESRSVMGFQSAVPFADAASDPMLAGPGFSLIPGTVHGSSDIMATSATISQPLFSKQWGPELGRQFVSMIRPGENGSHIAELRLDPPELGPLRVTININDSVVQAMFSSAHASVRSAVEQALPQLQQQLEQEGLSLGQTSVGHDDTHEAPSHMAQSPAPGGLNPSEVSGATTPVHQRVSDALVDTFA